MPTDNQMPSNTGVRTAGDHYQWLHAWSACMDALYENLTGNSTNPVEAVGVEVPGVGNVDDVVRYRRHPPHVYAQVKYAVDSSVAVGLEYLDSQEILRKMAAAHAALTDDGTPVEFHLITNRSYDPADLMMSKRDGRDGRLVPRGAVGSPTSKLGRARAEWASAACVEVDALLRFFADFHIDTAYEVRKLSDDVGRTMTANGLRSDDGSIDRGVSWIEKQVRAGNRRLTLDDIRAAVSEMNLQAGSPWTSVSVATITHDQLADQAAVSIDWVEQIAGDQPRDRIAPKPPNTWTQLADELATVPDRVMGSRRILVGGHMRQATGFYLGSQLQRVRNYQVAIRQGDQVWSSEEPPTDYPLTFAEESLGLGTDDALVVNISFNGSADVREWIEGTSLPVGTLTIASPAVGIGPGAVPNPTAANSLASAVRDRARRSRSDALHLFLIGPLGIAVLMGHHWNRVTTTHVYEHLGFDGYVRAFTVEV